MRGYPLIIALTILAMPVAASAGDDDRGPPAYTPPPAPGVAATPGQGSEESETNGADRIGRVSLLAGDAWWFVESAVPGSWIQAEPNLPIVSRSSLSTRAGARAEVRLGGTTVLLDGDSQADFVRVANDDLVLRVARGSVSVSTPAFAQGETIELAAGDAQLLPRVAGTYALHNDPATGRILAQVHDGQADLRTGVQTLVLTGWQQAATDAAGSRIHEHGSVTMDSFAQWVAERKEYWNATGASQYVSTEMTGADVLASHGQWEQDQAHGAIWYPVAVDIGWTPYRDGRWTNLQPWGPIWVDMAPWGFATSWYGRWHRVHDRWGWVPGNHARRPVFHPPRAAASLPGSPRPDPIRGPFTAPLPPPGRGHLIGPPPPQPPRQYPVPPRIDPPARPYPDPPRAFPNPPRAYPTPPRSWPSPSQPGANQPRVPDRGVFAPRMVTKPQAARDR